MTQDNPIGTTLLAALAVASLAAASAAFGAAWAWHPVVIVVVTSTAMAVSACLFGAALGIAASELHLLDGRTPASEAHRPVVDSTIDAIRRSVERLTDGRSADHTAFTEVPWPALREAFVRASGQLAKERRDAQDELTKLGQRLDTDALRIGRHIAEHGRPPVVGLSRLESGELAVIPETVDVTGMAQAVGRAFEDDARAQNNTLEIRAMPGIHATLDRRMLHTVLYQLMSSACRHTRGGTVKLLVAEVEDHLRIIVTSAGMGIGPRVLDSVRAPFATGTGSRPPPHAGSGLALAVVHRLIEDLGGSLRINDAPNYGASADIRLPRSGARPRPATSSLLDEQPTVFA